MLKSDDLITGLDSVIAERSLLKHPFYRAWNAGELSIERLRNYAVQYYRHVEAFPRYLSAVHSRCENLETRQALLENLIEEERGSENHPELWLRFAEGLGLTREEVVNAQPGSAVRDLVQTFTNLTRGGPFEAGLTALYAYESQIPAVAGTKIDGLKRFYGVCDDRSLSFFTVHQKADLYHSQTTARLLSQRCVADSQRQTVFAAANDALDALWRMLDSV